jgi:general stress protein 26
MTVRISDFAAVERALRRHGFGTLSTVTEQGRPHATGVVYAVSPPGEPLNLYVTTRTTTRKVRNVRAQPDVAFVIPVPRRFAPGFPPRVIQFQGTATVVSGSDEAAIRAFASSWFLRRILMTERRIVAHGGMLCFLRIHPDTTVFTYGMGRSLLENIRRPRDAIGRVTIPPAYR